MQNFRQLGSSSELEYHLQFVADGSFVPRADADADARLADVIQVRRMLIGLLKKVCAADGPVAVAPQPTTDSR